MTTTSADIDTLLEWLGDDDRVIEAVERYLDALPEDAKESFSEIVRVQAGDEGCRWSELEGEDLDGIKGVAGWSDKDFADVLKEKIGAFAEKRGELADLHGAIVDAPAPAV